MHPIITSPQNPKIKNLLALEKSRERKKQGVLLVEGEREISLALQANYTFISLFFCEEIISREAVQKIISDEHLLIPVSKEVFQKIAIREGTGGMIGLAQQKKHGLEDITLSKNPLVLILEAVEKPGNLGAILRTADAAGIDAVIICDPHTDIYNPNVIRSSVGCIFTKQTAVSTSFDTIEWLRKNNITIFCTYLRASDVYHKQNFNQPCAIVMGTEATGLSDVWVKNSDANIIIPMQGKIDSMNVSTAAAVVVFEATRQRGF
jgi:TrmH family RNA methyltransferase